MKVIYPDYNNCLTNVTNSLFKHYGIKTYHNTLKELDEILENHDYKNIVYMLYDGMGSNLLKRNLNENEFLNKNKIRNIHSVFPTTTTAATTSVLSGKNPNEHGWLGWDLYFKNIDTTVTMFLNTIKDTDIKVSKKSISEETYPYDNIVKKLSSKTNSHILFPFGENLYQDLDDMHNKIINICNNAKRNFIYAYCDEPDHTIHEVGTNSKETKELFKTINDKTAMLCSKLKDTLIIIVADHGLINAEPITLSEYKDIFSTLRQTTSIESRACAFFIKNEEKKHFEELFHKYFDEHFILLTKEEVLKKRIFGLGKNNKHFENVIGDYLAIATSNKFFRYDENSINLKAMHAGITEDEVLVPLIVIGE